MTTCSVAECGRRAIIRAWCRLHYQRWRDHGDPTRERPTLLQRLLAKVRTEESGCWEWTAARDRDGYGVVKVNGRMAHAHRASWIAHYGEIPASLFVLHSCDNPPCINPEHLMLGTQMANVRDAIRKGRRSPRSAA